MAAPYVLQFEQMSLGEHELMFDADAALFKRNGNEEVIDAGFKIGLKLYKTGNMMDLRFDFDGNVDLTCDRCNEPLNVSIKNKSELVVKFGQTHHEDLDELIVLEDHEHDINLEQYFFEMLTLFLPARHVHDEKDCNQEMIKRLDKNAGEASDDVDPRWQKLKEIEK